MTEHNTICVMATPDASEDLVAVMPKKVDYPHATLLYMGKPEEFEEYDRLIEDLADVLADELETVEKISARATKIITFDSPNEQGLYPKVLLLESPQLKRIHKNILKKITALGYESVSTFVGEAYTPHITLGYVEDMIVEKPLKKFTVEFSEVMYSAGSEDYIFDLGTVPDEDEEVEEDTEEVEDTPEVVEDDSTEDDAPAEDTDEPEEKALERMSNNPNAVKLRKYWTVGPGGRRKIRWRTPGDWRRCVRNLRKYVPKGQAERMCANYHKLMTGVWPGDRRNKSWDDLVIEYTVMDASLAARMVAVNGKSLRDLGVRKSLNDVVAKTDALISDKNSDIIDGSPNENKGQ